MGSRMAASLLNVALGALVAWLVVAAIPPLGAQVAPQGGVFSQALGVRFVGPPDVQLVVTKPAAAWTLTIPDPGAASMSLVLTPCLGPALLPGDVCLAATQAVSVAPGPQEVALRVRLLGPKTCRLVVVAGLSPTEKPIPGFEAFPC